MNKGLITALIVLGIASVYLYTLDNAAPEVSSFDQFKTNFGKTYLKEEELYRKNIFLSNVAKIEAHNANAKSTYLKGINKFEQHLEKDRARRFGHRTVSHRGLAVPEPAVVQAWVTLCTSRRG